MFMKTLYTPGVAHLSYIFGDAGQASVIDPRRDVNECLEIAHRRGAKITHIFETHRNEDYVITMKELKNVKSQTASRDRVDRRDTDDCPRSKRAS
jgi:hydroxyacylglutathione hydrolase